MPVGNNKEEGVDSMMDLVVTSSTGEGAVDPRELQVKHHNYCPSKKNNSRFSAMKSTASSLSTQSSPWSQLNTARDRIISALSGVNSPTTNTDLLGFLQYQRHYQHRKWSVGLHFLLPILPILSLFAITYAPPLKSACDSL